MSRSVPGRATRIGSTLVCRIGRHRWGTGQGVGAGIVRQTCSSCGMVTIDLTRAEEISGLHLQHQPPMPSLGSDR